MSDDEALKHISKNVALLRGSRSRSWLAREVGSYPINITRIERGEHMPSAGLISRLADALEVSVDYLLSGHRKKSSG